MFKLAEIASAINLPPLRNRTYMLELLIGAWCMFRSPVDRVRICRSILGLASAGHVLRYSGRWSGDVRSSFNIDIVFPKKKLTSWGHQVNRTRAPAIANAKKSNGVRRRAGKIQYTCLHLILYPFVNPFLSPYGGPAVDYIYANLSASPRLGFYLHKRFRLTNNH